MENGCPRVALAHLSITTPASLDALPRDIIVTVLVGLTTNDICRICAVSTEFMAHAEAALRVRALLAGLATWAAASADASYRAWTPAAPLGGAGGPAVGPRPRQVDAYLALAAQQQQQWSSPIARQCIVGWGRNKIRK